MSLDEKIENGIKWDLKKMKREVKVSIGEKKMIKYEENNMLGEEKYGRERLNVEKGREGEYLKKVEWLWFKDKKLKKGEEIEMKVVLLVEKELVNEKEMKDVKKIKM